jgi:hypothetical protein
MSLLSTSWITKLIDHNPFVALTAALAVVWALAGGTGCAGRAISPFTGEPATADEIAAQADAARDALGKEGRGIEQDVIAATARLTQLQASLGSLDDRNEELVEAANAAIEAANAETERRNALLTSMISLISPLAPPGLPVGAIGFGLAGALGLDRVRAGVKIRTLKQSNGT